MFDRITFNPQIIGGRACIRGMRITVSLVVSLVANGMSIEEILREYPDLEAEDISASLQYAAFLTSLECTEELATEAIVTVQDSRYRLRRLPIQPIEG